MTTYRSRFAAGSLTRAGVCTAVDFDGPAKHMHVWLPNTLKIAGELPLR